MRSPTPLPAGLADMSKGLQAKRDIGAELKVPYHLGVMAGLCTAGRRAGRSRRVAGCSVGQNGRDGRALV